MDIDAISKIRMSGVFPQAFYSYGDKVEHRVDDITRVCDGCRELAVSKIHQTVEVDCQILLCGDSQDPVSAIIAAGCGVVYVLGHEVHE